MEPVVDVVALARDLRPQAFGNKPAERIAEPVVEPAWPGIRVVVAASGGSATILADGEALGGHESITAAVARMLDSTRTSAILDGYLTKQIVNDAGGVYTGPDGLPSTGALIAQSMVGSRRNRAEEATRRLEAEVEARTFRPEDEVNLVIVDLLWLDGEWLLDVPLLERKRLLEAVVPGDALVRPGLYVRPPLATWIGSWRAQGFTAITFKAANSRYAPGSVAADWTSTGLPRR